MRNITVGTVLAILLSCLVVGCENSVVTQRRLSRLERMKRDSIDSASFRVGVMPTLDCLPVFVAQERRLFDTLGVTVHLRGYAAQMDCDTALERGRVIGTVTDLFRAAKIQKRGTQLTYPISTGSYWQLITNRKARISDLKQLSDKMIAMTRYSVTDYLADLAVDSAKPKSDVYRVQINDVNIRLKMLLNNEMDAVLLTEPQATKAVLEKNVKLMDSRDKNLYPGVFAFRVKGLKEPNRQKQLDLFVKAYNMAVDSINHFGLQHYSDLIRKYCAVDEQTVKALPKLKYSKAKSPRQHDLDVVARQNKEVTKKK